VIRVDVRMSTIDVRHDGYSTLRVAASAMHENPGLSPEAKQIEALRAFERMHPAPEKNNRVK